MKKTKGTNASIFELNGIPQLSKALPLALQHVVAMIVGCVTPAIIVAGGAGAADLCCPGDGLRCCLPPALAGRRFAFALFKLRPAFCSW